MSSFSASLRAALRSPLLPYWLVVALLPFGRSAELGTALCLFGTVMLFLRFPHALEQHEGARCLLLVLAGLARYLQLRATRPEVAARVGSIQTLSEAEQERLARLGILQAVRGGGRAADSDGSGA